MASVVVDSREGPQQRNESECGNLALGSGGHRSPELDCPIVKYEDSWMKPLQR